MTSPAITIGIVCYNHADFIGRAIESVLSQKTSYSYEILISDDVSNDRSREIILEYFEKYPDRIRYFFNEKNRGPVFCASILTKSARGKYIAWLDADDYWTFNSKLQVQLNFLENNPDYTGCFHDAMIKSTVGKSSGNASLQTLGKYRYYSQFNNYTPDFEPLQLLKRNIIPTASLVFRNRDFSEFFSDYELNIHSFSWAFQLHIIRNGKFKYINRCWSIYTDHADGLSKKLSSESFSLNNIRILKLFRKDKFYRKYRNRIFQSIAYEYDCIVYKEGKLQLKYAIKSQSSHFKAWWWTAWYYKSDFLKNLFR